MRPTIWTYCLVIAVPAAGPGTSAAVFGSGTCCAGATANEPQYKAMADNEAMAIGEHLRDNDTSTVGAYFYIQKQSQRVRPHIFVRDSVSLALVLSAVARFLELLQHLIKREAAGLLTRWVCNVGLQVLPNERLRGHCQERVIEDVIAVSLSFNRGTLQRIASQVFDQWYAQRHQRFRPHFEAYRLLLEEQKLPPIISHGGKVAVIRPVEELFAGICPGAIQKGTLVVSIQVNLECLTGCIISGQKLLGDVRFAGGCHEGWDPVFVRNDTVDLGAQLDDAGPTDHGGNAIAAFPTRVLLSMKRRCAAIRP